jgi:hypothetical protein
MLPRTIRIAVILALAAGIIARAVALADSDGRRSGQGSVAASAAGATGTLFFDATYHRGSLGPWSKSDVAGQKELLRDTTSFPAQITIVRAPGLRRVWAARFSVSPASAYEPKLGGPAVERTEVVATPGDTVAWDGRVTWYSWAMYFPRGFQSPAGHSAIVDQAKRVTGRCGRPNLVVEVNTEQPLAGNSSVGMIRLNTKGGFITDNAVMTEGDTSYCPGISLQTFPLVPFRPSHWFYVLLRVAWSPDPAVGAVTAWVNGCRVLPFTHVATLYSQSSGVYWRQGLYERLTPAPESVIQLGVRTGTSAAAVTRNQLAAARPRKCG